MMKALLILAISFCFSSAYAIGQDRGNGGDLCELRFNEIRDDIRTWIQKGGSAGLQLPETLNLKQYDSQMLEKIEKAQVSCTDDKILIGSAEKTCMNFSDSSGDFKIKCNLKRFLDSDNSAQYTLVHHEYAGLAGFEVNSGDASDYRISKQISGYLESQVTKKLVIKPPVSSQCNLLSSDQEKELISAIARNELACIRVLAPILNLNKPMFNGSRIPGSNWGDNLAPLGYAARLGHTEAIQILIDAGAYIHYEYPNNGFAIAIAAFTSQAEAVKILVKNGAFLNYNICSYGRYQNPCHSPLGNALATIGHGIKSKTFETVETLLKLGANPNYLTFKQTPLAYAVMDFDYVDLLVKYGVDPNLGNEQGRSAIFFCYSGGCVDKLVAIGADVNRYDFEGHSPLDFPLGSDARAALIRHGAHPNPRQP